MTVILIGALLIVAGVVYMADAVLRRGRLSDPAPSPAKPGPTLEPRRRGLGFLGLTQNWPGLLMVAIGVVLLLSVVVL
ncbi:hypothetical protein EH240_05030 [Mesorhizobium tamadayense]|uniref:Uncharacterized protein n=1 Tax=Mesorhizobium tamadayense TaxID=425306 RepID=A0A3P3G4V8_9HYPH|nr:hypothetical protein [Mesorhizobium tamadayense]RRI05900.1 hypothetical protein EH240_05030 [Mesorhizobium tamadayense]